MRTVSEEVRDQMIRMDGGDCWVCCDGRASR